MKTAHSRAVKKKVRQEAFIEALYDVGVISYAADAVGVGRRTVYDWRAADPDFADEMQKAIRRGLFDQLMRVANDGRTGGSASVLIFLGKTVLGLSDRSGENTELRQQLENSRKEIRRMRHVVFRAARDNPELAEAISREIEDFEDPD